MIHRITLDVLYVRMHTHVYVFHFSYKPVQMVHIMTPLKEDFERLFRDTFSLKHNARFLSSVQVHVHTYVHILHE